jgi:exonuclease VII small subunit
MALWGNGVKTTLGGLAIGVGVAVAAPIVLPILASIVKPLTKAVIKEGLVLYRTGKETVAEAKEAVEDLVAEARAEIAAAAGAAGTKDAAACKARPLAQAILDEGKALYDKGKDAFTEAKSAVDLLVEEAKAEIAAEAAAKEA